MKGLSIVIPAYNEEDRLGRTLGRIADAVAAGSLPEIAVAEIVVADDGSADRTSDIAREWSGRLPTKVVRLPENKGKGAAMRAGVAASAGEYVLMYDADGATPITEIPKLFRAMEKDGSDIAIGSRVLERREALVTMQLHRRLIGRTYHALCSLLVPGIHDTACGCKLFKAAAAKQLFSLQRIDRFAFDVEVLALALRHKYRISEVPLEWTAVPESKVRVVRDGLQMFWCVISLYVRRLTGR
jgi:dolichyl-phosphate beta-glucosyltransferase